jgi:hypothetical protein
MGNGAAQIGLQTKSNLPKMLLKEIGRFVVMMLSIVLASNMI